MSEGDPAAYLLLEDGRRFDGEAAAPGGVALGECVFTTAMTGYQEALTDPSFAGQILTFTAPMIGNYGVDAAVGESDRVQAAAMICREARDAAPPGTRGLLAWLGVETRIRRKKTPHGSGLGRTRCVVERTVARLKGLRRMRVRYDRLVVVQEAWNSLAASVICYRILKHDGLSIQ